MGVTVNYASKVQTEETLTSNVPAVPAADAVITHSGYNTNQTLTSATTPPATQVAYFSQALSSGSATIDLTSLTGANGISIDGSTLKVQVAKFKNPSSNANSIKVDVGATNGYQLSGAGWEVTLEPGQETTLYLNDASPDIGASAKTLDLTGTGSQALEVSLVLG
jgi:hypothetical protein